MSGFGSHRCLKFFFFLICSISLHSFSATVSANDNMSNSNVATKTGNGSTARSSYMGFKIALVCLGIIAVITFSVFLFKIWQKKKREEQHARLLKLFEEDDELEVELGIRD